MSKTNPKIALVLSSGGARGLAHVGVIKALVEANIPIHLLVGSSAGAIVAAFYATSSSTQVLEDMLTSLNYRQLFSLLLERPSTKSLLPSSKAFKFLETYLSGKKIEDLTVPTSIVASDLVSGQPYVFESGDLITALKASAAIPFVFPPLIHDGKFLIDGGATLPLPVCVALDKKADFIIASSLYKSLFPQKLTSLSKLSMPAIAFKSSQLILSSLTKESIAQADFHFDLDIPYINTLDFMKARSFVELAYKQSKKSLPRLISLLKAQYPSLQL